MDKKVSHLLVSAHFAGKDNKKGHIISQPPLGVAIAELVLQPMVLFSEASHHSYLFLCVDLCLRVFHMMQGLSASPARTRVPPAHHLDKGKTFWQQSLNDSSAGVNLGSQGTGESSDPLPEAVRASLFCLLVSPAEWHRHHHH